MKIMAGPSTWSAEYVSPLGHFDRDDKMTLGFASLSVKLLAELQFVLLSY